MGKTQDHRNILNNGWRLAAVGGWRLAVGSGWQLAVGGPWGLSLRAGLNKKQGKLGFLDSPTSYQPEGPSSACTGHGIKRVRVTQPGGGGGGPGGERGSLLLLSAGPTHAGPGACLQLPVLNGDGVAGGGGQRGVLGVLDVEAVQLLDPQRQQVLPVLLHEHPEVRRRPRCDHGVPGHVALVLLVLCHRGLRVCEGGWGLCRRGTGGGGGRGWEQANIRKEEGGGGGLGPKSLCTEKGANPISPIVNSIFFPRRSLWTGPQNGRVVMSALGSGRACPAAAIAFCPSCQCPALPQCEVRCQVQPSSLRPLTVLAFQAPLGYACIPVRGPSLPPVLQLLLAPFGHTGLGLDGASG